LAVASKRLSPKRQSATDPAFAEISGERYGSAATLHAKLDAYAEEMLSAKNRSGGKSKFLVAFVESSLASLKEAKRCRPNV
jgi:hypothetical protein